MTPADFATTKSLRDHIERAVTGKLTVGRGRSTVSVYLRNGGLIGAESTSDASRLIRRLQVDRALSEERASELLLASQDGESIFGPLFEEVDGAALDTALQDRFRDALADWLAADSEPTFTSMAAVFIDNMQMGVNSEAVLDEALGWIEAALELDVRGTLSAGTGMPRGKSELMVRALLRGPTVVGELVDLLPLEPWQARAVTAGMVGRGALRFEEPEPEPEPTPEPEPVLAPDAEPETEMLETEHHEPETELLETEMLEPPTEHYDAETEQVDSEDLGFDLEHDEPEAIMSQTIEPALERAGFAVTPMDDDLLAAFEDADAESEEIDRLLTADVEPIDDSAAGPNPLASFDHGESDDEFAGAFEEDDDFDSGAFEDADDGFEAGAFEEEDEASPVMDSAAGLVSFDGGEEEDAEVISAFNDANQYRGGSKGAGQFVTESHNLDRVSLGNADEDEDMEFEADEVPSQTFGAPRLSEEDAEKKVGVANSVLEVIAAEYDKAQGPGAGRAAVQLLVDGPPLAFAPLFKDVTANGRGGIAHFELLRNLYSRPATEHRRLLQDGIKNLLDRGMSIAADELPDEGVDAVLESAAGLRQRLGL